jgi:hypothetical protein
MIRYRALRCQKPHRSRQDDLEPDRIYMLDLYTEAWVWMGRDTREQDRKNAVELAIVLPPLPCVCVVCVCVCMCMRVL